MIQIEINEEKCIQPPECTVCLQQCPEGVFLNYPREKRTPTKGAGDWIVVPAHMTLCTGCRICESICPREAVKVTVDGN
ncbi:MAG: 4Fe-4S binding protein [Dehalococcoidales bacterium]|nr:MAG: 4Fe-4S binding protein [Dehalococcoidales bacterium]